MGIWGGGERNGKIWNVVNFTNNIVITIEPSKKSEANSNVLKEIRVFFKFFTAP